VSLTAQNYGCEFRLWVNWVYSAEPLANTRLTLVENHWSKPMRPLQMSFSWLARSTASQAQLLPLKISKSENAFFRFPATPLLRFQRSFLYFMTLSCFRFPLFH